MGWSPELLNYDYHVQYIPSRADCLSRIYVVHVKTTEEISAESLLNEQGKGNECVAAKLYLDSGMKAFDVTKLGRLMRYRKQLTIVDGLLRWKDKFVVPVSPRMTLLYFCPEHPMAGHFATDRV